MIVFLPFLLVALMLHNEKLNFLVVKDPAYQDDGPYVLYKKDQVLAYYIMNSNGEKSVQTDKIVLTSKEKLPLHVGTGIQYQTFPVQLKAQLQNEKSEYEDVSKLFAVSDIEGDFISFRKLLETGGVIDENFNWTFGNGHLVLTGDFLDRGQQVTEVLWLIYSLEEKAKAAGGYVHYILGNHEIMNLSGDIRYVSQKYLDNARLMQKGYERVFDKNHELGRWLNTKNIVEKIGKRLFLHGGISDEVNELNTTISDINQLVRPYYSNSMDERTNQNVKTILSTKVGPFWYRGYYMGTQRATQKQINKTLSKFDVTDIITGHTVVAAEITVHYDGKVIDLDTHDYNGHIEALLIEDEKYYRINLIGEKILLFE